jgi:hypothetical protein
MGFAAYNFTSRMVLHLDISCEQYLRPNISHIPKVLASIDGSLWFKTEYCGDFPHDVQISDL